MALVKAVQVVAPVAPAPIVESAEDLVMKAKLLAVSKILVTSTQGNIFDGDEVSQNRMARAVTASSTGDTTLWMLANNTPATVSHDELKEALLLSGEAMTTIWMASA